MSIFWSLLLLISFNFDNFSAEAQTDESLDGLIDYNIVGIRAPSEEERDTHYWVTLKASGESLDGERVSEIKVRGKDMDALLKKLEIRNPNRIPGSRQTQFKSKYVPPEQAFESYRYHLIHPDYFEPREAEEVLKRISDRISDFSCPSNVNVDRVVLNRVAGNRLVGNPKDIHKSLSRNLAPNTKPKIMLKPISYREARGLPHVGGGRESYFQVSKGKEKMLFRIYVSNDGVSPIFDCVKGTGRALGGSSGEMTERKRGASEGN
jgi:hypothetical protein